MDTEQGFRDRIKTLLEEREMSQAELGRRMGMTPQAVSSYLAGSTKHWPVTQLQQAEEILKGWIIFAPRESLTLGTTELPYNRTGSGRRKIPVVALRKAPGGVEATKMAEFLKDSRDNYWTYVGDEDAYGLRLTETSEEFGDFHVRDVITVSPAGLKELRHGSYVAIEVGDDIRIAKYKRFTAGDREVEVVERNDQPVVGYRLLGKIVELYRFFD